MHPLLFRPWHWLQGQRAAQAARSPRRCKLAIESLEDRFVLSDSPISPASDYELWRQTRFTIDDAAPADTPALAGAGASATPTNASFGSAISLDQALAAHPYRGTGYAVAVIDTGIDYRHAHLGGGWGNRVIAGWNFVNNTSNPLDDNGHGTHVAGIIGSSSSSYSGIAPEVNLVALKVLDKNGSGTFGAVHDALQWVIANQARYNIVAVNLSLGSGAYTSNPYSYLESDFTALEQQGVFIAAAAGNDHYARPTGLAYPAISPNVVSVGAVWAGNFGPASWASGARDYRTDADQIVSFSQRSSDLELLAPGALITSTYLNNGTKAMAGTSMATPMVAGAAVLLHQALDATGQSALAQQDYILSLLQNNSAAIVDANHGRDNVTHTGLTFRRLDVSAALDAIGSAPRAPTVPTLQPLGSRTMGAGATIAVTLVGADADGDAISYGARVQDDVGLAYKMKQQLGLTYNGSYYTNAWGENEHWLQGLDGTWYCLMSNGDLRRWAGTMTATLEPANLLAALGPTYYHEPALLWNAQPGTGALPAVVSISGDTLYVTATAGYTGSFKVDVSVSDGQSSATQTLLVSVVTPTAPQLGGIASFSLDAGTGTTVTLPGSDADGDALTYTAQLVGNYAINPAVLSVTGNQLAVQTAAEYSGDFDVIVTVSDGVNSASTTFRVTVIPGVTTVARFAGNFNGDGWADIVEFKSDGSWWVTLSGAEPARWAQWLPSLNWRSAMVGDFNGDRRTDVGAFSNDGSWWVGLSTGSSFAADLWSQWLPAASWHTVLTGDFNGDGRTDVAGFSNDGSWWIGRSTGGRFAAAPWTRWLSPAHWRTVSVGDFNGDGKSDIIGFNNDGSWWVGQSTGARFVMDQWARWMPASRWSSLHIGDFNGDGKSDVLGQSNDGTWWVGLAGADAFATARWARWSRAGAWTALTVGDANGDGKTDIIGLNRDGSWWVALAGRRSFATRLWNSTATRTAGTTEPQLSSAASNGSWAGWLGLADAVPRRRARPKARTTRR
jgi:subtilisin family serine protease